MKKGLSLIVCLVLLLGLIACGETEQPENKGFQIGFGRVDITPEVGTHLSSGTGIGERICEGIMDHLYAHAVVMKDAAGTVMAIITTDLSWGDQNMLNTLRPIAQERFGLDKEHFLMGGIHNHNEPDYGGASELDRQWQDMFHEAVMEAVQLAMDDLAPATVEVGTTQTEGLTFVRRYIRQDGSLTGEFDKITSNSPIKEPESTADEQMQLVRIKRQGKKDLIMVNWQCHPNKHGASQTFASVDFVGPLRSKVERELDALCIFYQGAAGNLNSYSRIGGDKVHGQGYENCVIHGELVADYAIAALRTEGTMTEIKTGLIQNKQEQYVAREIWAETNTVVCGELSFVTLPGEFFDSFGMTIKENTPFKMTLLLGYHCATPGTKGKYIATEQAFANGGYETWNTNFSIGDGEKMTQYYVDTLKQMYK